MCENIKFIDISGNQLISELNNELFNQYFYIQKEINSINIDNDTYLQKNLNQIENIDRLNKIEDIKNKEELNKAIRIKANNSKIMLFDQ